MTMRSIEFPMIFQIRNPADNRLTYCGVLEFNGAEGKCVVPAWVMHNINLEEGVCVVCVFCVLVFVWVCMCVCVCVCMCVRECGVCECVVVGEYDMYVSVSASESDSVSCARMSHAQLSSTKVCVRVWV